MLGGAFHRDGRSPLRLRCRLRAHGRVPVAGLRVCVRAPGALCVGVRIGQAQQYLVTKLDLQKHVAHTRPVRVNYYTVAHNNVDVNVTKRLEVSADNHAHT